MTVSKLRSSLSTLSSRLRSGAEAAREKAPSTSAAKAGWTPSSKAGAAASQANPYGVTLKPRAEDWTFQRDVKAFQESKNLPAAAQRAMGQASEAQLLRGISRSWVQNVTQGGKTEKMTVELTRKLIPVPYETFVATLPPAQWGGSNLARYLGGEVQVLARDEQGRPTRQIERMVLAQDDLAPLLGPHAQRLAGKFANDMTKAETITYSDTSARVEWRVFGSDNGSTLADLGSVTFEKAGAGTLVTFHSAHKLGVPGTALIGAPPIGLPAALVGKPLEGAFLAHVNHYQAVVGK